MEGRAAARVAPEVVVVRVVKAVDLVVPVATPGEAPVVLEVVVPAEVGQVAADPVGLLNRDRSCLHSCRTNCD